MQTVIPFESPDSGPSCHGVNSTRSKTASLQARLIKQQQMQGLAFLNPINLAIGRLFIGCLGVYRFQQARLGYREL